MQRISTIGVSGCGKSSPALALAERTGYPCLELNSIFHGPGWTALARDPFRANLDDHDGQKEPEYEGRVELTAEQFAAAEIQAARVGPGEIADYLIIPAVVSMNTDASQQPRRTSRGLNAGRTR